MRLIITEKASVSRSIASVLRATQKQGGYFEGNGYLISHCAGHLLKLAAPQVYDAQFAKWNRADLPIIPKIWQHLPIEGKTVQLNVLKDLMNRSDVDCVINACDAGREGELIFRLVYEYAKCIKPTLRFWVSSMEEAAIRSGMNNLKPGKDYDSLYAAASCRERADWLIGLNSTRLFSTLYGTTLNVGRVQSPTLAMIVKRTAEIDAFVKQPFYIPLIECDGFTASGEKFKDRKEAEAIRMACEGKPAHVCSVKREQKTIAPPKLYDLTSLQREANRYYGFTAQETLDYAQSLYEKAMLSYPRTDSRYLTEDMRDSVRFLIASLQQSEAYGIIFTPDIDRLLNNAGISDHHAIIPTDASLIADLSALPPGEHKLLQLVSVRLLCAVAPVHRYEAVAVKLSCGAHSFTAKGRTVIAEGWKAVEKLKLKPEADGNPDRDSNDDSFLPEITEGQIFSIVTATIKEGMSQPPRAYTEDTLLSGMENAGQEDMPEDAERKGLGTPATRASIIEKLIESGFVERREKNLLSTDKGKSLVAVLPHSLTSPRLTAEWEHRLKQMEQGEISAKSFMDGISAFTKAIVAENTAPKPEFSGLFGGTKTENESLGTCPRCGSAILENPKAFSCAKRCGFALWKEAKFWTTKKKTLTAAIAATLLKDGRVALKGLFSEKTGKKYDATVILDDPGKGYVSFRLEFSPRGQANENSASVPTTNNSDTY